MTKKPVEGEKGKKKGGAKRTPGSPFSRYTADGGTDVDWRKTPRYRAPQDRGSLEPRKGRCGAKIGKTDPPKYCTQYPLKGKKRCKKHGGRAPAGLDHPSFKGRHYSVMMPPKLRKRFEQALTDPDLIGLRSEVALVDTRIGDLLEKLPTSEAHSHWDDLALLTSRMRELFERGKTKDVQAALEQVEETIQNGQREWEQWHAIFTAVENRRKLVDTQRRVEESLNLMVSVREVAVAFAHLHSLISRIVTDPTQRAKLGEGMAALVQYGEREDEEEADFEVVDE